MNEESWRRFKESMLSLSERLKSKGVQADAPEFLPSVPDEQVAEFERETGLRIPPEFARFLSQSGGFSFWWCLSSPDTSANRSLTMNGNTPMTSFGGLPDGPFVGIQGSGTLLKMFNGFQRRVVDQMTDDEENQQKLRKCFPLAYDNGNLLVLRLDTDPEEVHFLDHESNYAIADENGGAESSHVASGFGGFMESWSRLGFPDIGSLSNFKDWLGGSLDLNHPKAIEWIDWLWDPQIKVESKSQSAKPSGRPSGRGCLLLLFALGSMLLATAACIALIV